MKENKSNIFCPFKKEDLQENDVWILSAPADLDPEEIQNSGISFSGKSLIITQSKEKFESISSNAPSEITMICQKNSGKIVPAFVPCKGQINIFKYVDTPKNSRMSIPPRKVVQFPSVIKKRHPLFGTEMTTNLKKIKQEPLCSDSLNKEKKKKKKKKHKKDSL